MSKKCKHLSICTWLLISCRRCSQNSLCPGLSFGHLIYSLWHRSCRSDSFILFSGILPNKTKIITSRLSSSNLTEIAWWQSVTPWVPLATRYAFIMASTSPMYFYRTFCIFIYLYIVRWKQINWIELKSHLCHLHLMVTPLAFYKVWRQNQHSFTTLVDSIVDAVYTGCV